MRALIAHDRQHALSRAGRLRQGRDVETPSRSCDDARMGSCSHAAPRRRSSARHVDDASHADGPPRDVDEKRARALRNDARRLGDLMAAGRHPDGRPAPDERRLDVDGPRLRQRHLRPADRSARRQEVVDREHGDADGPSRNRTGHARPARDGFPRPDHRQERLSAAFPDRGDGRRQATAGRIASTLTIC